MNGNTSTIDRRASLYKSLYNAARNAVHPAYRDDSSAVRALRDHTCATRYNRCYQDLTDQELMDVIAQLQGGETKVATINQVKLIKYYAVQLAIIYADLGSETFMVETSAGHSVMYGADEFRHELLSMFAAKQRLPLNIVRRLYDNWINPTSNRFLVEGEFKKFCKCPTYLRFERLSQEEANYLINRFAAMHDQKVNKTESGIDERMN